MPSGVPSDTVVAAPGATAGASPDEPPREATVPAAAPARARPARFEWGLAAIGGAAFVLRAAYVVASRNDTSLCQRAVCGDAHYYVRQAATVAAGHGFVDPSLTQQTADHPPLTSLVLAPANWLFTDPAAALLAQRLLMAALGAVAAVLVGLLGRRIGRRDPAEPGGERRAQVVGLVAAAIAAVDANLWMNDVVPMSETLATLAIVGLLLAVYRYVDRPTLGQAALVGLIAGVGALARAELALLGALMFVPMALRARQRVATARLAQLGVAALAAVAVIAPWTAYNLTRFDQPVWLSTNDGLTLAGANCDQMYGLSDAGGTGFWSLGCAFVHEDRIPRGADQSVRARIYREIGVDYARSHLDRLRVVVEHRLLRGWGVFAPDQMVYLNAREGRAPWASWTGLAQWWLLLVPALLGVRVLRHRGEPLWPLASTAVVVTLVLAAFYGLVRFRLAADVAVIVLAAVAVEALVPAGLARRRAARAPAGTLAGTDGALTAPAPAPTPDVPPPLRLPAPAARRAEGRFPCLDAYRAMGMTMVLLNHAAYATGFQNRTGGLAGLAAPVIARLDVSVPMFFVLSGFLLFRPFARSILTDRPLPSVGRYYRHRALRILPSYWVALAGVALLVGLPISGLGDWLGNALFAPAFGVPQRTCQPDGSCPVAYGLTPAWSIGVEVAFYAALPLIALGLQRLARHRPAAGRPGLLLGALAGLYVAGTAFRAFVVMADPPWAERSLLWLPMFVDIFAIGMALGVISVAATATGRPVPRLLSWAGRHPVASWAVAGAIFAVMTTLPYPERPFGLRDAGGFSDYLVRQCLYGVASACWLAPAMFGDQRQGRLRRLLASRPLAYLGTISLSFYLWHLPLVEMVKEWTVPDWHQRVELAAHPPPDNPMAAVATFTGSLPRVALIAWVLSFLVAAALYRLVEAPFLRLKDQSLRAALRRPPPLTGPG